MTTCRLTYCHRPATHESQLCPIHAMTWLLTPGARLTGPAYTKALEAYCLRAEVREHQRKHPGVNP